MGPFAGLRVIDMSPSRLGAQISQLFADFGAEVIWVEPPGGSTLRQHRAYPFWARGKQNIRLDLRDPADVAKVRELAATADVFIETSRPGVLAAKGLGYDDLIAINPSLVYTSITGFGPEGPYRDLKAYEGIVAAKLGILHAFRRLSPTDSPPYVSVPWCSFAASQVGLYGTLGALLEREQSGLGQHVETSLAQAVVTLDTWSWFEHLIDTRWPEAYPRTANFDDDGVPASPFPFFLLVALTKDGHWLQFAQVAPHLFAALMKALGLEWVFTDPRWEGQKMFADKQGRFDLWTLMLEAANKRTLAEWQAVFDSDPNVFAEVFRDGPAVLDHPQLVADQMYADIVDAERGPVHQPGPLARLYGTPAELGRSAPTLADTVSGWSGASSTPVVAVASGDPSTEPALDGLTVVELAVLFAAPNGTRLLADMGARVIKVEPLEGDPIRTIIPFPESGGASVMQGKESICVDLGTEEGLQVVYDLIKTADVVMQGYRAGVAERMGLGYERLKQINPDIVYLNAPGYGTGAPNGHRPAYAPSIGAATGVSRTNVADLVEERPDLTIDEIRQSSRMLTVGAMTSSMQSDGFASLGVASAILVGALARARGAGGQEMLTTMLNTGAHAMSAQVVDYPGSPADPRPGLDMRGVSALYRIYDAADGWVFLAAASQAEFATLAGALRPHGAADLLADERFATVKSRMANDEALIEALSAVFVQRGQAEWEHDLRAADVACVAVTMQAPETMLWSDEFGRASGYLTDVVHPVFDEHPRMNFLRMSRSTLTPKAGVLAGSHTDSVLAGIGRDEAAIADLRARKIVG
ncbi:MAG: CoA transferase [Actinomycetota bacterium]|nr:CoA transferase [Actinomycetota bacterium]